ncbi:MAG: HAD-IC family P-type ATPase, partial [Deltaproteobacteria bacterium]|nr:HAD-IC family P-type ATPase [Deltaproteobacteria bacterium]
MIYPLHTKVPGRARYRVAGLYGSEPFKKLLESRLSQEKAFTTVSASVVTGNLLVCFNSGNDHRTIRALIEVVLREGQGGNAPTGRKPNGRTTRVCRSGTGKRARIVRKIRSTVKDLFTATQEQETKDWHLLEGEAVLAITRTERGQGLSREAAVERTRRYGPNLLPESASRSRWSMFADQFKSLPVMLLSGAAVLSVFTGGILDAVVIMGVVVSNSLIGYWTESRAERTIQALKGLVRPVAEVLRDGCVVEIPSEDVVPGDLLVMKPGTYVCADSRVLEASHLSIDESALTGESMPVFKSPTVLRGENTLLADRGNMLFMGTLVTGGEGVAVVVATGRFTEMGRLQLLLGETTRPETPIERQLRGVGDQLVLMCMAVSGAFFGIGLLRGYGILEMMRLAVSLAASAVPEGLPAAATINFSLGIQNM